VIVARDERATDNNASIRKSAQLQHAA